MKEWKETRQRKRMIIYRHRNIFYDIRSWIEQEWKVEFQFWVPRFSLVQRAKSPITELKHLTVLVHFLVFQSVGFQYLPDLVPVAYLAYSLILKMEAVRSSETSLKFYLTAQHHIPEESILHSHRCENLKSHIPFNIIRHCLQTEPSLRFLEWRSAYTRTYRFPLYTLTAYLTYFIVTEFVIVIIRGGEHELWRICRFHCGGYEEYHLLGYNAV
jgi:hypothetical protein